MHLGGDPILELIQMPTQAYQKISGLFGGHVGEMMGCRGKNYPNLIVADGATCDIFCFHWSKF